jgi:hypothetical protein
MPRLTLKGDTTNNIGEYLPAPFIDRIYIVGAGSKSQFRIRTSVFVQDEANRVVLQDGKTKQDEEVYRNSLEEINYYTMILIDLQDTGLYELMINDKYNPLAVYKLASMIYPDKIILEQFKPMTTTPQILFDENGNEVLNYCSEKTYVNYKYDDDVNEPGYEPVPWKDITSMQVLTFASTTTPDNIDINNVNLSCLDVKTSDISYEIVFEGGEYSDREQMEYVDNNDVIYSDTPLIAIDSLVYKANKLTHEQIVAKFKDLLNEFSTLYEKDKGFDKLKRMMDKVSLILEVYNDQADLLPQLNTIRKIFPDKTFAKPIGKFYKRFGTTLFNINKIIKDNQILKRRIIYNRKTIDLRPGSTSAKHRPSFDSTSGNTGYIYTDWVKNNYTNEGSLDVVLGYFFFDYEKAIRRRSNISELFDVNKLENWGIHIPYENFIVDYASVIRAGHGAVDKMAAFVEIKSIMKQDKSFPLTKQISVTENSTDPSNMIVPDEARREELENTPYGSTKTSEAGWAEAGFISSLVLRNFINPTNKSFSEIENYRLMCYELLDYRQSAPTTDYSAKISITDNTISIANDLITSCRSALSDMKAYYELVNSLCAYDDSRCAGVFNDFFSEAVLAKYEGNIGGAPWLLAPLIYSMHLDLIYNIYGGDLQQIAKAAKKISVQINPVDGTKKAIEVFINTFSKFISDMYGSSSGGLSGLIGSKINNMSEDPEKVFEVTLAL